MYARFFRWASDRLAENGVLALVTNRSFIESRTFDGFRAVVAKEFHEIWVMDLGGDVRANPKLSGTKHNVFGIQTGVAISFMVKKAKTKGCRIYYARRPEMETAEEKLSFLASRKLAAKSAEELRPDAKHNWINLPEGDFESLIPLSLPGAKFTSNPRALFRLFTNGVNTARDEWVYDFDESMLMRKMRLAVELYDGDRRRLAKTGRFERSSLSKALKWSEGLLNRVKHTNAVPASESRIVRASYRPFVALAYYADPLFSDRLTGLHSDMFGDSFTEENICLAVNAPGPARHFYVLATSRLADWHFAGDTRLYSERQYDRTGSVENITDWALEQFRKHYQPGRGKKDRPITKEAIFHYVYGVLHDPIYREKYALNLKREFPRIPFYADFWQCTAWGETLMKLHIEYETVTPAKLERTDVPDEKARAAKQSPKPMLKADKAAGVLVLDSETTLRGVPASAWEYKLGNRSALEWILDQYKEKKPKDPTIREKFDTYRFADYKEKVIDLLRRVTTVSVETVAIVEAMRRASR